MNHMWSIFRKDGTELLRDRRTIFVNVVLPVLLYPIMLLFLMQVYQLTQANQPPPPQVVGIDLEPGLVAHLVPHAMGLAPSNQTKAQPDTDSETDAEAVPANTKAVPAKQHDAIRLYQADAAFEARLRPLLQQAATAPEADLPHIKEELLTAMRSLSDDVVSIIAQLPPPANAPAGHQPRNIIIVSDDAQPHTDEARGHLNNALDAWKRDLIRGDLTQAGISTDVLYPVTTTSLNVAPLAQATRMRLAGIIPLLLVVMAVSGAFYPALDLIAGERERGTLETLLTWPISRRDIFLGKLCVTICAAMVAVILNLASLGITVGLAGSQLMAGSSGGADMGGLFAVGAGTLALSLIALFPLVVTLSALSLALAGFAASSKEAQNYLSPLFLVVVMAAAVAQVPDARPTFALDLVPITGPVLALKESLRSASIPWLHLLLSTASSIAVAAVVVTWSVRLLDQESFCYPNMVRAGWGRWKRWQNGANLPGGLEALGLFAACTAAFILIGPQLAQFGVVAQVAGPLIVCLAIPVLIYRWAGNYSARTLLLSAPKPIDLGRGLIGIPLALALSMALSTLQPSPPPGDEQIGALNKVVADILGLGGLPLLVMVLAIVPGICEEMLCRGPLLVGLRRGLGTTGAVAVSAFCFAALHMSPYRFIPQGILGVFLAILALRSGSIWPGVLVHAGHNAAAVLLSGDGGGDETETGLSTSVAIAVAILAIVGWVVLLRGGRKDAQIS